jgi:hypothetical protein
VFQSRPFYTEHRKGWLKNWPIRLPSELQQQMSRCLGRLVNEKIRGQFRDGHYFHIEVRCENSVGSDHQLCSKCEQRPRTQMRTHATCLHGLIGGEIPAWSHLFGSAWYLSKVEAYGQPSESEMARAKKAIADNLGEQTSTEVKDKANSKPKPRKLKVAASETIPPVEATPAVEAPLAKPKAKRKPKAKETVPDAGTVSAPAPATVPTSAPAVVEVPVKAKSKRKLKIAASEVLPPDPVVVEPVALESSKPVQLLAEEDILMVRVRPFEHNGTTYWLQSSKDKLYTVPKKDELPKYVGRYNRVSETIDHDFPDSDEEH